MLYTYPHDLGDGTTDVVITVTAALSDGYAWADPLPDGWVQVGDTTVVRFELTLEAGTCTPVTPAVRSDQAVCADGVLSAPTLVLADTDEVTYTVDPEGPYVAGDSGDGDGDAWPPMVSGGVTTLPGGWVVDAATTATLAVVV